MPLSSFKELKMSSSSDKIKWNQIFEMGIVNIDDQHRVLVDTINKANHLLTNDYTIENLQEITKDLINYADFHFKTEEELMETYQYSSYMLEDYDMHIQEHREFSVKVQNIHDELVEGNSIERAEIINFLCQWLIDHTHTTDKKLGYFLEKNIT